MASLSPWGGSPGPSLWLPEVPATSHTSKAPAGAGKSETLAIPSHQDKTLGLSGGQGAGALPGGVAANQGDRARGQGRADRKSVV